MKHSAIQIRRKPRQSRAKLTQEALQDSFVRLLHERPASQITIREITDLAGVGLGTFYEYFSKKEDLIALTIHLHVKHNAESLKSYAQSLIKLSTDLNVQVYLERIIHFQIEQIQAQQFLWSQVFLLERQISDIESYRKSYAMMVKMWQSILEPFIQNDEQLKSIALNMQRVCYGFVSQTLLIEPEFRGWDILKQDIFKSPNILIFM
ncbi:TetR/AcrR family transcriptional regulator [Acinetobacter cumulans]|uniref:TetR/AcrR family transcriptional regulator n=1 Tax=Acinetobacter cumulans TaxID=2136182 RepID=A0A3A8G4B5_9GAMM|nr:TetR/AcrR family transcriptional regulator [Acinetobacter cumulans]RKG53917.1 TetR/AcrR family transcriptional regulator [Acinetobacter cumulans]